MMQMDCAEMIGGAGGTVMMAAMGLVCLLLIAVLILGAAALVKYLRAGPS